MGISRRGSIRHLLVNFLLVPDVIRRLVMVCCTHQCNTMNALTCEGDTDFWSRFIRPPGSRKPPHSPALIRIVEGRVADVGAGTGLCNGHTRKNEKEEKKE